MQQTTEEIKIPTTQDLIEARNAVNVLKGEIAKHQTVFDEETRIQREKLEKATNPLYDQLRNANINYESIFDWICKNVEFGDDKFLKTMKINGKAYSFGKYKIIQKSTTKRTLDIRAFKKKYGKAFQKYAKIELGKADAAVGKENVDKLCEMKITYSFEFFDPDENGKHGEGV